MKYYPNRFNLFNDDLFENFFTPDTSKAMACDIKETEDTYQLAMNVPGFNKEDLSMSLEDGYLTVLASHTDDKKEEQGRWIRQERYTGSYQRSFYVGKNITEEDIHASYKNGVLAIEVPKHVQKTVETKKMIPIE